MKGKLDHIGIAVKNMDQAVEIYKTFGLELEHSATALGGEVKIGFLPVGGHRGAPTIEFVEPLTPDSSLAKFIERHGEGLHHVCLEVENIDAALAELKAKGWELIDKVPRRGGEGMIAFINPKETRGALVELIQRDR